MHDKDIQEKRKELFNLMRKKYPGGQEIAQREFCDTLADERIPVYMQCFKSKSK